MSARCRTVCLHGPESTGKSTLAPKLAAHFGSALVEEYGRTYCEQHGLDLTMADLVAIGATHDAMIADALARCTVSPLILDTDPLMTAVWADMLFGRRDPWFDAWAGVADLYLFLDSDVPWVDDGTRFFGSAAERKRFRDLALAELERRGVSYVVIDGPLAGRLARAVGVIELDAIAHADNLTRSA